MDRPDRFSEVYHEARLTLRGPPRALAQPGRDAVGKHQGAGSRRRCLAGVAVPRALYVLAQAVGHDLGHGAALAGQARPQAPSLLLVKPEGQQQAFRGHLVVLCDEGTASDGEAFSEGFRRLGLGKVIGTRTWGGEIWLSFSNVLADRGIASAGELGVYGPERKWLIEGHGVDPDITIDNLPHAAFEGKDAQLDAAVQHLQKLIKEKPVTVPEPPDYPDKTVKVVTTSLRRPK